MAVLGKREVPIPEHIDIFHLTREMPASDKSALKCVMEVDEERLRLEKLAESLIDCDEDGKLLRVICFLGSILNIADFRRPGAADGHIRAIRGHLGRYG